MVPTPPTEEPDEEDVLDGLGLLGAKDEPAGGIELAGMEAFTGGMEAFAGGMEAFAGGMEAFAGGIEFCGGVKPGIDPAGGMPAPE